MAFIVKVVRVASDGTKTLTTYNQANKKIDSFEDLANQLILINQDTDLEGQLPHIAAYVEVGNEDHLEVWDEEKLKARVPALEGEYIVVIGQGTTRQQFIDGLQLPENKQPPEVIEAEVLVLAPVDHFDASKSIQQWNQRIMQEEVLARGPVGSLHTPKSIQQWKQRIGQNVWKFFSHPGTWTFLVLLMVGMAIAFPFAAPALIVAALTFTAAATLSLIPYAIRYVQKLRKEAKAAGYLEDTSIFKIAFDKFKQWAKDHPMQAFLVGLGLALFVTALVLTIGFFTGGGAFAFMAPVFAAIAAPLATAAAAAGVAVANTVLTAIAAGLFVLATLHVANLAKRFFQFIDEFRWLNHGDVNYSLAKLHEDQPATPFAKATKAVGESFTEAGTYLSEVAAGMRYVAKSIFNPSGPDAPDSGNARNQDVDDGQELLLKRQINK